MPTARKTTAADGQGEIATVRIELRDSDPLIWRQVEVLTSINLKSLHDIIQVVMGWADYHLWEFTIDKQRYGPPLRDDWGDTPRRVAAKVHLRDVLKPRKTSIDYLYDFGDSWELRLVVTNVRGGEPGVSYPRYIGGECNAPPEDCGGIPGYYSMLNVVADPHHPDHAHIKERLGNYDPNAIDALAVERGLGRIANRRSAARKHPALRP